MADLAELVDRGQRGDGAAFDELVRLHYAAVWRIAIRYAAVFEDACDLVQETFIAAYEHLHMLNDASKFPDWLAVIARNTCLSWQRKHRAQPRMISLEERESEATVCSVSLEQAREQAKLADLRRVVSQALTQLLPEHHQVLGQHYLLGRDYGETGALLNLSETAVRGRLYRAREALRKELQNMAKEVGGRWELHEADLDALRTAAAFAWPTAEREVINAICFGEGGWLVATDSYRLFCHSSSALRGASPVVVHADLGRMLRDRHPQARHAYLELAAEEAVLYLDDGATVRAPLVKEQYPNWQRLLITDWAIRVFARAGDWLESLQLLARARDAARMPDSEMRSRIIIVLALKEERIVLHQGMEPIAMGGIGWEHRVSLPARYSDAKHEVVFAANAVYLEEAIRALGLPSSAQVELAVNGAEQPFRVAPARNGNTFVLTMPMRLPGTAGETVQAREGWPEAGTAAGCRR